MSWRTDIESSLTQSWQEWRLLTILLLPLAFTYRLLEQFRRLLFAERILRIHRVPAKVVVVGNVITGGAGKTPTLLALAESLQHSGYAVGIISRGYGRASNGVQEVLPDSDPLQVGDEPLLIRRRLSLPVFVGGDRVAAAKELLRTHPHTCIILSDDGLQHLRLYRDLEIYVFDNRGTGNGLPLPAGPMRSPWPPHFVPAAGQSPETSVVLHTGSKPAFDGYRAMRRLAAYGIQHNGNRVSLASLSNAPSRLVAVAGIAQPESFFQMLAAVGIKTTKNIAYPDHYEFTTWQRPDQEDWIVVCTEKDAVKLWHHEPEAIAIPLVQDLDTSFLHKVLRTLGAPVPPAT